MRCVLILLGLSLWSPAIAQSPVRSPQKAAPADVPFAERARQWVAAFNSNDAAAMERFVTKNFASGQLARSPADRAQIYNRMKAGLGTIVVEKVEVSGAAVALTIKDEHGSPAAVIMRFDAAPPFGIERIAIEAGGPPTEWASLSGASAGSAGLQIAAGASPVQLAQTIDGYLGKLTAVDRFSGVVLVADGDKVLFERAYGPANRAYAAPNATSTRFDVGSITKDFTKVAIGQLAQQGRLDLDAPISRYLPDYPNKEVAAKVTVAELVNHSSGLGDVVGPAFFASNMGRLRDIGDFIPMHAMEPLAFAPGTSRRYSNFGYVLLGAIIERISGESYQDYIQSHVFAPAGMSASLFPLSDRPVPDIARGYIRLSKPEPGGINYRDNSQIKPLRGMSYGGSFSTAHDLLAFVQAMRDRRLLDARWTEWFLTGKLPAPNSPASAVRAFDVMAAGGSPGINASLVSANGLTIITLCNMDPPTAEDVGEKVLLPALQQWRGR